jgi:hypothetical protein
LPVKYGWQALQISRRRSFFVEWVWKVLPQAQTAVTRWSWGWMLFFIGILGERGAGFRFPADR